MVIVQFNPYLGIKGLHTVPKSIIPEVNVIARLEFELGYNDVTVQHISHYTTRTYPSETLEMMK